MEGSLLSSARIIPTVLCLLPLLSGCGAGDLPGHYWDVVVDGTTNACTGGGANYREEYAYRVIIDGNDISVAIDEDIFATGLVDGCRFDYDSLVWSTYRDDFEIQWQITGTAYVNVGGGGGCVPDRDWEGTETFIVTTSAHPDVSAGCTYETEVTGKYVKEVQ